MSGLDRRAVIGAAVAGAGGLWPGGLWAGARTEPNETRWIFDRLSGVRGEETLVEGAPRLIDSPAGKAVAFDGIGDRLVVGRHPLAGLKTFTFEALFRPDGGAFAQRWFHLAEEAGPDAPPSATRVLFEIRVTDGAWCLDAFVTGPGYKQTLLVPEKTFPVGRWAWVAQSYDGKTYRSYVNGVLQAEAEIAFRPQGQGKASIGARMNRVDYFKGAVREARFCPHALAPDSLRRAA